MQVGPVCAYMEKVYVEPSHVSNYWNFVILSSSTMYRFITYEKLRVCRRAIIYFDAISEFV